MAYGNNGNAGFNGGGARPKFEPKSGTGSLFPKQEKKSGQSPDWDGYFIADRAIQAGEKIKLVGWDKHSNRGTFITLKVGREPQDIPGGGQPQQGYQNPQYSQPQQYQARPPQQYQQDPQKNAAAPQYRPTAGPAPVSGYGAPPDRGAPPPQAEEDLPF